MKRIFGFFIFLMLAFMSTLSPAAASTAQKAVHGRLHVNEVASLPCLSSAAQARAHYGRKHRPSWRLVKLGGRERKCWYALAYKPAKSAFALAVPATRRVAAVPAPPAQPAIAASLPATPIEQAHAVFTEPAVSPEDAAALWGAIRALVGDRATLVVDLRDKPAVYFDGKPVRVIRPNSSTPVPPDDMMLIWPARLREDSRERPAVGRE